MGLFTKQNVPAGGLQPPSKERIAASLDARDMNYGQTDDGQIGGFWDGHLFMFLMYGEEEEILQVRGRWNRVVDASELPKLAQLTNAWNADRIWPKMYVEADESGVQVIAEYSVMYSHGLTDEQLDDHLGCGVQTALGAFEHLDEHYPEAAAKAKAEEESGAE